MDCWLTAILGRAMAGRREEEKAEGHRRMVYSVGKDKGRRSERKADRMG